MPTTATPSRSICRSITARLRRINGTLPGSVTVIDGNGSDGTLAISGSASDISAALTNGINYMPAAGYPEDVLTVTVHDSTGLFDSQQVAITNTSSTQVDIADGALGANAGDQIVVTPSRQLSGIADDG